MKRINLIKYGLVRTPDEDFTNKRAKFSYYQYGRAYIAKVVPLKFPNSVYLVCHIKDGLLRYDEFVRLPGYSGIKTIRGQRRQDLTEEDIKNFCESCIKFEQSYVALEKTIVFPTKEELRFRFSQIKALRQSEVAQSKKLIENNEKFILKLPKFEKQIIYGYLHCLENAAAMDIDALVQKYFGTVASRSYMEDVQKLESSYDFKQLCKLCSEFKEEG